MFVKCQELQQTPYIKAGNKYGIDPAFLASVSMAETGNGSTVSGNNVGGMMKANGSGLMAFGSTSEGIDAMASNLKKNYIDDGLTTPEQIQKRYAPEGAGNDPNNLNSHWLDNVTGFYSQMAMRSSGGDAFKDWRGKITSAFGEDRGDHRHTGLDLAEEQGTMLNALAGGRVTSINMDDGGQYDADGRANTRMGGTELVVTMDDGRKYSYSHMSEVNADLLAEYTSGNRSVDINSGAYLGKSGGDPKLAGSGYSTTGPHLHLGYTNAEGRTENPASFLESLAAYDTGGYTGEWSENTGKLALLHQKEIILNERDTPNFLKALDTSKDILNQQSNVDSPIDLESLLKSFSTNNPGVGTKQAVSQESRITVDVNLKGEGASQLNSMTTASIQSLMKSLVEPLVQRGIEAYRRQQLAMNPTMVGW